MNKKGQTHAPSTASSSYDRNARLDTSQDLDHQSEGLLSLLAEQERVKANRVPGVRTALVVLSSKWMPFDTEALRQKIHLAYPESTVFFLTTLGKPVGAQAPKQVDLLIDFTGPGQRQGWFYARSLRRKARVAVGRNAGLFRSRIYDRVVDEKAKRAELPSDSYLREKQVQKLVLELSGVSTAPLGETPPDRSKSIALELPPLAKI